MGIGTSGGCMRERRKQHKRERKLADDRGRESETKDFKKKKIMFDSLLVARHCTLLNLLGYFGEFAA